MVLKSSAISSTTLGFKSPLSDSLNDIVGVRWGTEQEIGVFSGGLSGCPRPS